ncbi:MAG: type II toxin-antitoxin system HicA family toxin [Actinobacteria bacterium]|nr:type II toxin-antitoxin system HicA family toxin [Chloroflexota bacterium]MBE3128717.1 type II toxin-antitoxin system HicA family toxin [Actinomycetota bacterium]
MPKLKILSGIDITKIFFEFGFEIVSQKGSHVKLRRILTNATKQTLTIPLHDEFDKGTLRAIFRQAVRYIPEEKLNPYFYD